MAIEMPRSGSLVNRRRLKPWIIVGTAVIIAAVAYPFYFDWWDHRTCQESGGTWNEARGECVEPRGAEIPDTEKSLHSSGGDNPRE
jgi:hypothetical protein